MSILFTLKGTFYSKKKIGFLVDKLPVLEQTRIWLARMGDDCWEMSSYSKINLVLQTPQATAYYNIARSNKLWLSRNVKIFQNEFGFLVNKLPELEHTRILLSRMD